MATTLDDLITQPTSCAEARQNWTTLNTALCVIRELCDTVNTTQEDQFVDQSVTLASGDSLTFSPTLLPGNSVNDLYGIEVHQNGQLLTEGSDYTLIRNIGTGTIDVTFNFGLDNCVVVIQYKQNGPFTSSC